MNKMIVIAGAIFLTACSAVSDIVEPVAEIAQQSEDKEQRQVTQSSDDSSPTPDDPYYAPIEPGKAAQAIITTGSLFNTNTANDLYSNAPNFKIGDNITVLLKEDAVATKSAKTNLSNDSNFSLDPITVPGGEMTVKGKVVELGMKQNQAFDGQSGTTQSHNLVARITVTVVDILNNGNLVVRGEKWLVINNGKEYIRLTGIVRPLDVTEENAVDSYQVADSRIEFSGTGEQADIQTRGWLSSLFSGSLWPF